LLVEKSSKPGVDFKYRIFNADGGEVEQCGNGSRCFVRFVHEQGLSTKNEIQVEVAHTVLTLKRLHDDQVEVDMGQPIFNPTLIPFNPSGLRSKQEMHETLYALPLSQNSGAHADWIAVVSMGNPHAVQIVEDLDSAPVLIDGPLIESHPAFQKRVNAGFVLVKPCRAVPVPVRLLSQEFGVAYLTPQCVFILVVENYRLLGMALVLKLYRLS
jgi:diaminopimelate epimerase